MLPVTSLAAVALGAMFIALTLNVIRNRGRERVTVGSGSETLARAIRAQGNFAESTPITLVLLALAVFVAGRIGHAYSLIRAEPNGSMLFRMIGMLVTLVTIAVLGVAILVLLGEAG
jgi:uncharacterized membrane protein YecN with MAPEG domain